MALDLTAMKATFAKLVTAAPISVTFGAVTFSALRTELQAERRRNEYGGADNYSFSLMVAESALTSWPSDGDTVTIASVVYRVIGTYRDPLGVSRRIDLENRYQ